MGAFDEGGTSYRREVSVALIMIVVSATIMLGTACIASPTSSPAAHTPIHTPVELSTPATTFEEFDLREANVLNVAFQHLDGDQYRFDVTLLHNDVDEAPDFADWWQVEDLDGNLLGRRVLTHSHDNLPFTRSGTIAVPESTTQVIVRGHDMRHGYGGRSMHVDLLTGETIPFEEDTSANP